MAGSAHLEAVDARKSCTVWHHTTNHLDVGVLHTPQRDLFLNLARLEAWVPLAHYECINLLGLKIPGPDDHYICSQGCSSYLLVMDTGGAMTSQGMFTCVLTDQHIYNQVVAFTTQAAMHATPALAFAMEPGNMA